MEIAPTAKAQTKRPAESGPFIFAHQSAEEMFVSNRERTSPAAPPATPRPMAIDPDAAAAHPDAPARSPTRAPSWTPTGTPSSRTPSGTPTPTWAPTPAECRSPSAAPTTAPSATPAAAPSTTVPAAAMPAPTTAMPLRIGGRWHKGNDADNQRDACAKLSEFGHRCISYGAPPRELPSISYNAILAPRVRYSHQQCICGTITAPLTRYSATNQERHCRTELGPT